MKTRTIVIFQYLTLIVTLTIAGAITALSFAAHAGEISTTLDLLDPDQQPYAQENSDGIHAYLRSIYYRGPESNFIRRVKGWTDWALVQDGDELVAPSVWNTSPAIHGKQPINYILDEVFSDPDNYIVDGFEVGSIHAILIIPEKHQRSALVDVPGVVVRWMGPDTVAFEFYLPEGLTKDEMIETMRELQHQVTLADDHQELVEVMETLNARKECLSDSQTQVSRDNSLTDLVSEATDLVSEADDDALSPAEIEESFRLMALMGGEMSDEENMLFYVLRDQLIRNATPEIIMRLQAAMSSLNPEMARLSFDFLFRIYDNYENMESIGNLLEMGLLNPNLAGLAYDTLDLGDFTISKELRARFVTIAQQHALSGDRSVRRDAIKYLLDKKEIDGAIMAVQRIIDDEDGNIGDKRQIMIDVANAINADDFRADGTLGLNDHSRYTLSFAIRNMEYMDKYSAANLRGLLDNEPGLRAQYSAAYERAIPAWRAQEIQQLLEVREQLDQRIEDLRNGTDSNYQPRSHSFGGMNSTSSSSRSFSSSRSLR